MRIGKRVARIGAINPPLIPADIWCWYDFADTGTLVTSGGKISFVADKSGQGHNGMQATSALQPTLATINGLNAALFSHANKTMLQSLSVPVVPQPTTWLTVHTLDVTVPTGYFPGVYTGLGQTPGSIHQKMFQNNITNDLCIEASDAFSHLAGTLVPPYTQQQVTGVYKGTSSYMYINGVPGTTTSTSGDPVIGSAGFEGVTVGSNPQVSSPGDGNLDGKVCELMIYNRELTSGERLTVEAYLKAKWGTP